MVKKLRIKFVIAAMAAISLVLFTIIGAVNIHNYVKIKDTADLKLEIISTNGGFIISDIGGGKKPDGNFSPEAQYETRYFIITLDSKGIVCGIDMDKIAAVDLLRATNYSKTLFYAGKTKGYIDDYRYLATRTDDGFITYAFVDCSRDLETFRTFLMTSLLTSIGGLMAIFILVLILSAHAVKPLEQSLIKQKQFITDANHELKTPLTVIQASCDVLELDTNGNEWTGVIKTEVEKLTKLTNQLVFLSRMDEDNAKASMTDFSLSEVCEEEIQSFNALFKAQGKSFDYTIAPELSCYGDMGMIKQVISILLENASKYSDDDGNIKFSLSKNNKHSVIEISNTTNGLPKGNLDMLFERFYRLDTSRNSKTGGHGIGLSVAKAVAELHNGKITANSIDGKTITFTLTI